MTNLNFTRSQCDLCGSKELIINYEEGSLICKNCGNVLANHLIDHSKEWRTFFGEDEVAMTRTGAPVKLAIHDKGITTEIKLTSKDKMHEKEMNRFLNLSKYQKRLRINDSKDRNFYSAFILLDEISIRLGLPERVKETAAQLYRKTIEENPKKGRSIRGLLANCIYIACKICDHPIRIKDIMETLNVKSRTFSKYYAEIINSLSDDNRTKIKSNTSLNYVPMISEKLGLNAEVEIVSKNIIEKALNTGKIAGKSPLSIAAAAVYIACTLTNNKRTQRQIAECAGITEVTIRNISRELIRNLDINVYL